jgi:bifunctional enzyme CysN/CysC
VLNDIGRVSVNTHQPLYYDAYKDNRATGAFIILDPMSNFTVGAGVVRTSADGEAADQALIASDRPRTLLSPGERRDLLGQSGATIWLTGVLDSGKAAVAYALERRLVEQGRFVVVVDPFDGQHEDLPDGGHIPGRTAEWAQRLTDAGAIVIFTYISPSRSGRRAVRARVGDELFLQVTTVIGDDGDAPSEALYDTPKQSVLTLQMDAMDSDEGALKIEEELRRRGLLPSE